MIVNRMFASVYIGSYEVTLKIFEFTPKRKFHQVDLIRSRLDLGRDIFRKNTVGYELVDELCKILTEFKQIIMSYQITDYDVYASVIFRDIANSTFVMNQIFLRTGLEIRILSNSEHRFMSYQAVAGQESFEKMIQTSAAVVDVGGSSLQITLFEQGKMTTTQKIDVGAMRILSMLNQPGITQEHYQNEISEYINKTFDVYRSMYLQDSGVDYLIFMSDYGVDLVQGMEKDFGKAKEILKAERFQSYMAKLQKMTLREITKELNLSDDSDPLIIPSIMLFSSLVSHLSPKDVWFPGVDINDGIAYDFAQKNQLVHSVHDFEADVLSSARKLANHYHSYSPHIEEIASVSMTLFDTLKKIHGLGKRERLLLEVASILHDCGKYISFSYHPECAYQIIISSEILGLNHREREIIARTVLYNTEPLDDYEDVSESMDRDAYLTAAKLAAILRVSNALDQSHRQKFRTMRISLKERSLIISVEAFEDLALEQMLFDDKTAFFENIYSIKPVLKQKRVSPLKKKASEKKPAEKKPAEKKPAEKKPEDKETTDKKPENREAEDKKTEVRKTELKASGEQES